MSINLLLWVNCYCSIKLFPIKFSQEGIKSGCALFLFIPSLLMKERNLKIVVKGLLLYEYYWVNIVNTFLFHRNELVFEVFDILF